MRFRLGVSTPCCRKLTRGSDFRIESEDNTLKSEFILTKKPKYIHATRIEQAINICPAIIAGQPKLLNLA